MVAGLLAGAVGCGGGDSGDDDSAGVLPDSEGETENESDDDDDTGGAADDDDDDEPEEKLDVGTGDDDDEPMEVCLGEEPAGDRLSLFGCEPCTESSGVGTNRPRWFVARVDVPSYPYRIDAIGAVVSGGSPAKLVYFENNSLIPPADPVFEWAEVDGITSQQLHVATLEQPVVIEESERLFVGVYLEDSGDTLFECADTPDGDPQVWFRDDPPVVHPWQALLDFTPQIYAYGEPD